MIATRPRAVERATAAHLLAKDISSSSRGNSAVEPSIAPVHQPKAIDLPIITRSFDQTLAIAKLIEGVAVLSYCPGGITAFGLHFDGQAIARHYRELEQAQQVVNDLKVRRKMSVGRSCVEPSAKIFRGRRFDTIYTLWLI